ncbi:hypothetical protein TREMEDRAFT_73037 [Tremella mesenterica DSM 1558]|nr:uncharacterized protein TREMEDRAFT_73037 [Tremella mesenterica DSM 1558]EIW73300.1 hypothetical protein TREMEDRAFT_73037 [Tremella mesenterica DSM 1558]
MSYAASSLRPRQMSNAANAHRASSYSTLLAPGRASSQYPSHSRHASGYYATYPIATPSSMSHDASPPMPPSLASPDASPPLPSSAGTIQADMKPNLSPINTRLDRGTSIGSGEHLAHQPRHKSSVDRLRNDALFGPGSDRAPSPASAHSRGGSDLGEPSSRNTSPHPSTHAFPSPSGMPRQSFASNLSPSHRPLSMASLGSSRYLHVGPAGGAPHQGRPIQLEMPRPLGARPDASGDFFHQMQMPKILDGFNLSFEERQRQNSNRRRGYDLDSGPPFPDNHSRVPSSQSSSSNANSRSGDEVPPVPPVPPPPRAVVREKPADPATVLGR